MVILTLGAVGLLVYLILKGVNPVLSMLSIGIVVLIIMQYATQTSVLGDATTGIYFLDIFKYIYNQAIGMWTTMGATTAFILGYVGLMQFTKANDFFALTLATKLSKMKSKWVIYAGTMFLAMVIKWLGPNQVTVILILISTVYPVLLALKVNRLTAISVITICSGIGWGPATPITPMTFAFAGESMSAVDYFMNTELIYFVPMFIAIVLVFAITTPMWERKEAKKGLLYEANTTDIEQVDPKSFGLPGYYMLLPLMPIIMVILFGGIAFPSLKLDTGAIYFLAAVLVLILQFIRAKEKKVDQISEDMASFWKGFGDSITMIYPFVIGGMVFSAAIGMLGGVNILVDALGTGSSSQIGFMIIVYLATTLFVFLAGMGSGFMPVGAILGTYIVASGADASLIFSTFMLFAAIGNSTSLTAQGQLVAAGAAELNVVQISKRNIIPLLAGGVVAFVIGITIHM
ncbi:MAG: C4-dicarboxylate transporter DcuC [Eubacteriaceae bacterium]